MLLYLLAAAGPRAVLLPLAHVLPSAPAVGQHAAHVLPSVPAVGLHAGGSQAPAGPCGRAPAAAIFSFLYLKEIQNFKNICPF